MSKRKADGIACLGTAALRERGWTPALIRDFLGAPDKLSPNPYSRSAPPARHYARSRVETAEATGAFKAALAVAAGRSTAAKSRAEAMRARLLEQVRAMGVTVTPMPMDRLMAVSLRHWENSAPEWDCTARDGQDAPIEVRHRWCVNYARHHLTRYDRALEEVAGKVGVDGAVRSIRGKVYAAIAARWPELADECCRQAEARQAEMEAREGS